MWSVSPLEHRRHGQSKLTPRVLHPQPRASSVGPAPSSLNPAHVPKMRVFFLREGPYSLGTPSKTGLQLANHEHHEALKSKPRAFGPTVSRISAVDCFNWVFSDLGLRCLGFSLVICFSLQDLTVVLLRSCMLRPRM